jgi:hypothetical protein
MKGSLCLRGIQGLGASLDKPEAPVVDRKLFLAVDYLKTPMLIVGESRFLETKNNTTNAINA